MRKQQSSLTAIGIAVTRAVESEKPEGERICYDPFARRFLPGWMYYLMAFFIRSGYTEWRGPGVNGFLVARERYIDDTLEQYLQSGLQQLVLLGAGFDSRAYRFPALRQGVKVFEVDHPATQADKLARLQFIFGRVPDHVAYVPVDFNTQALAARLEEGGFQPGLKTLFLWQGVSMYLTAEAVDATLAFVRDCAGAGSAIVFDYIYREVLDGAQRHSEVSNMRRFHFISGEGLTFGIPQGQAESFLKQRGFRQVSDVNADDLRRLYFTGKNAGRKVAEGYGIMLGSI